MVLEYVASLQSGKADCHSLPQTLTLEYKLWHLPKTSIT